jgi:restriction endonuclease S subunit
VCSASAGAIATSNLLIIRPGKRLRAALIFVFLQSPDGLAQLTRMSAGSTTLALRARDIAAVKMPIPPLKTQDTIAELVDTAEQYYDAALRAATLRRTFGHTLAQRLIYGQETRD